MLNKGSALYFLDFFVPNDGDVDTALEVAVLRWTQDDKRPSVYLHSFLKPVNPVIVRWSNALSSNITKEMILKGFWPSYSDLLARDFLAGKEVVCLNPELDPCYSFTRNSTAVHGIISEWNDLFEGNEEALKNTRPSQMLEFLGLPVRDESNTKYTPLLCRLHSLVAIYSSIDFLKDSKVHYGKIEGLGLSMSKTWPIPQVNENIHRIKVVDSFDKISREDVCTFFSDALPDYLDWYELMIYAHDWKFCKRDYHMLDNLSNVFGMAEFIFSRVLSYQVSLWSLIFYSIYENKTSYAREIALSKGNLRQLPENIKVDFSRFLIIHLEDFLSLDQKKQLIRSIFYNFMLDKSQHSPHIDFNFDDLYKKRNEKPEYVFETQNPPIGSYKCFKEIRRASDNKILYRAYEIYGIGEVRDACIDRVNQLLRDFVNELYDPFASFWWNKELRLWIQYITGFTFKELSSPPRVYDEKNLTQERSYLRHTILENAKPYINAFKNDLRSIIVKINDTPEGPFTFKMTFFDVSIDIIVYQERKPGILSKLLRFN